MIHSKNLCFSYNNNNNYVIDNLNLDIKKGSYVSIIGENGSGKTTLVKLLLNILKPTKGEIKIDSNNIGYVPQKVDGFNSQFPITVYEVLNIHRKILKIKDSSVIDYALEAVNMAKFKNSLIGSLSGGQQQKIFIARAIMGNSDLIILDEPSTALDQKSIDDLYNLIKHLNKIHKITVLSIEHNISLALKNSTHIYAMNNHKGMLYTIDEYSKLIKC